MSTTMTSSEFVAKTKWSVKRLLSDLGDIFNVEMEASRVIAAGGAVRDMYFGRECNDIDIYIEAPFGETPESCAGFITEHCPSLEGVRCFEDSEYQAGYSGEAIAFILEAEMLVGVTPKTVQMIFMNHNQVPVRAYVSDFFSCSLSKIYMDQNGDITYFTDFVKSVEDKVVTFEWDHHDGKPNMKYIRKILNYFPDYAMDKQTYDTLTRSFSAAAMNARFEDTLPW